MDGAESISSSQFPGCFFCRKRMSSMYSMHSFRYRHGLLPVDRAAALFQRAVRLGVVTEPMAAFVLLPVIAVLLASTADYTSVGALLAALGLVLYQASVAMGGRYIV
jgi:hypothetical protein